MTDETNDPAELRNECKEELASVLGEYPIPIGMIAMSELLASGVKRYHSWDLANDE